MGCRKLTIQTSQKLWACKTRDCFSARVNTKVRLEQKSSSHTKDQQIPSEQPKTVPPDNDKQQCQKDQAVIPCKNFGDCVPNNPQVGQNKHNGASCSDHKLNSGNGFHNVPPVFGNVFPALRLWRAQRSG
jgi:hypothetical protein